MGYGNPDLEEIRTQDLLSELERRKTALEKGLCPYCGQPIAPIESHGCKYADQIMDQYSYDEFVIQKFNEQENQKPN